MRMAFAKPFGGNHVAVCRHNEIDSFPSVVDGTVEILSTALDLDVSLVHSPADVDMPDDCDPRRSIVTIYFFARCDAMGVAV